LNILAVDIGGTFTDLMAFDHNTQKFYQAKSLSTPGDLAQAIIDCIEKSGLDISGTGEIIHGTTQAINTLIERKGAKTALLVTRGTRDVYIIGRGNRPESYNLMFHQHRPLAERRLTFEVDERMLADGSIHEALNREQAAALCEQLKGEDVDAVAVCFLHAYANPEHEQVVGEILKSANPDWYVSLSHEIMREYREFERTSTTVVNAYIGPRMSGYVRDLEERLKAIGFTGELSIMQSNGGVMTPEVAVQKPVTMMESGPVGGIIASAEIGRALGFENVISFDMGGTTAKTSLIRGGYPTMAEGYYVGGYASGDPVMSPVVDVVEVGAGGGSIAWIDEVGALKVGPQSSGADPGPICYQAGGTEPTITDANVILGRVGAADFLGGEMSLDTDGALSGTKEQLADKLGMNVNAVAGAIIEIAVTKMSLAVREVSVEKGYDPRDFVLIASGGAGPLHAVAIAAELHIPTVIIPLFPAHFSALGMLMADERQDFIQTYLANINDVDFGELLTIHRDMRSVAQQALKLSDTMEVQIKLDLRYVGQEFTLQVPIDLAQIETADAAGIRKAFDDLHEQRYAHHAADEPVEMVNYRLVATVKRAALKLPDVGGGSDIVAARRPVYFDDPEVAVDCPVYDRRQLVSGYEITGPALIQEYASSTVMFAGDTCVVTDTGELIITLGTSR
jgi:N-methylhydantoinase A